MIKVLFISRKSERCGVADYGKRVYDIIKRSCVLDVTFREVEHINDCSYTGYDVLLINYHHATVPFLSSEYLRCIRTATIYHEGPMHIHSDTVLFTEIRPLFDGMPSTGTCNLVPTIGSFGFGFPDKNFPRVASLVKEQFDKAVLRLNIPFAEFGDTDGALARSEVDKVKSVLAGSNIDLQVSHEYLPQSNLLHWLRGNDLNLFLYNPSHGRGLSSAIDYALSARRPIGVSSSEMFRHLPSNICVDNIGLPKLIELGIEPLMPLYEQHSNANLIAYYEKVITELCQR